MFGEVVDGEGLVVGEVVFLADGLEEFAGVTDGTAGDDGDVLGVNEEALFGEWILGFHFVLVLI